MSWPMLYQAHPRRLLAEFATECREAKGLGGVPSSWFASIKAMGFDWIYLLGAWQTGPRSREVSLRNPIISADHSSHLPDWTGNDVCGSPFAIEAWVPHVDWGGLEGLFSFRENAARHGLKLMLDFVPNHVGLDNPWAVNHPDWFFRCDAPSSAGKAEAAHPGGPFLKHGKDPYFPPWPDTFQLNLFHPAVRSAQQELIAAIATLCDGVRCDMAMLPLSDVFLTTWGHESIDIPGVAADQSDYWPGIIKAARDVAPGFQFLAECYWDREWDLMCQGFDYCYDKRLYERLAHGGAHEVSGHLMAEPRFLHKCAHFLENHDENRSPEVFKERLNAAAVITYLSPGLRFFHHGQEHGFKRKDSVHLSRAADERRDPQTLAFYKRLMAISSWAASREWKRLQPLQAWEGNPSHGNLIAMQIGNGSQALLAVVNYSSNQSQGSLALEPSDLKIVDHDLQTGMASDWLMGNDLKKPINFDLGPWKHKILCPAGLFPAVG